MSWVWQACGGGGGGGAPSTRVPALQSNIAANPALAMWALDAEASLSTTNGADRSGNGRVLTTSGAYSFPDIIPGSMASIMWQQPSGSSFGSAFGPSAAYAALQLKGEMSVTLRAMSSVWPFANNNQVSWTYFQYLVNCGNGDDATAAGNVQWSIGIGSAAGGNAGKLYYYAENGVHAGLSFQSQLRLKSPQSGSLGKDGMWHFVALRRTAAGVVTIDVDESSETSGALALPTSGTNARIYIGRPPYNFTSGSPDTGFLGSVKDVAVWPVRLTDAQILTQRKQMMGIP